MRKGKLYGSLLAAVLMTMTGGFFVQAETVLDTVYVNADRDKQEKVRCRAAL